MCMCASHSDMKVQIKMSHAASFWMITYSYLAELAVQGPSGHRPKLGLGVTVSSLPCRQSGEARLLQTNARSH